MRALLAAVQIGIALRAGTTEIDAPRQSGGTVEAAGGGDMLDQAGKTRTCNIDWGAWTLRFQPVITVSAGVVVRVLVPVLSILAIAIHGETLRNIWNLEKLRMLLQLNNRSSVLGTQASILAGFTRTTAIQIGRGIAKGVSTGCWSAPWTPGFRTP
jgi:hypothetical protein